MASSCATTTAVNTSPITLKTGHFNGLNPNFAFLGEPETKGFVERFNRTLKKQIIHGRTYRNCDKFAAVVATFVET